MTTMLEGNDDLKLSNIRNSRLTAATIQHWTLVLKSLTSPLYTNRHISVSQMQNEHRNSNSQRKDILSPHQPIFFKRQLIFFPSCFSALLDLFFLEDISSYCLIGFSFLRSYSERIFSSEVLIFQTFLPVFNLTCDKNPSCRMICGKQTSMHKNAYRN